MVVGWETALALTRRSARDAATTTSRPRDWLLFAVGRFALASSSGVLIFTAYPPWNCFPAAFVALVPLLLALRGTSVPGAGLLGWWTGCVACAGGFGWIVEAASRFEEVTPLEAIPYGALFIAYHGLQIALFAVASVAAGVAGAGGGLLGSCAAAGAWILIEHLAPRFVPWSLGSALAGAEWLRQAADLGGALLLSFLIVLINGLIAAACHPARRGWRYAATGAALVAALTIYGAVRLGVVDARLERDGKLGTNVTVGMVQGGVSRPGDLTQRNRDALHHYTSLSENLHGSSQLVLWPETVLRVFLRQDLQYFETLRGLVQRTGFGLVLGALDLPSHGAGELNTAFLLVPEAAPVSQLQAHHKRGLLPFAEYVPAEQIASRIGRWRTTGRFVPGPRPRLMHLSSPAVPFAASICAEALRAGWFNALVRGGAAFLVNLSSDDWFGPGVAPEQHFQALRLRAVETRRWLLRTSSSGISAFVDPAGRAVETLPYGAVGTLQRRIAVGGAITPYVRWGDWIVWVGALALAAGMTRRYVAAMRSHQLLGATP